MTIDKLLVIFSSLAGIIFVYWFFLMKKDKAVFVKNNSIDIKVEGGYQPAVISIPRGKTTKLNFLRSDPSSCLEDVILGDFKIRRNLPLNEKVMIEVTPEKTGSYDFTCGMGMFHGKLEVV